MDKDLRQGWLLDLKPADEIPVRHGNRIDMATVRKVTKTGQIDVKYTNGSIERFDQKGFCISANQDPRKPARLVEDLTKFITQREGGNIERY